MTDHTTLPVISAELFTIPIDGNRYLVYAPLRRAAFVANAAVVNVLADLASGHFDNAADAGGALVEFLRRLEVLDAGPERSPVTSFCGVPEPTSVTLFLTTACNLRCTYCYASAGDTTAKHMPLSVANRGIDFVSGNAHKQGVPSFEVAYHGGGEPSVNWRVMTESLAYARRKGDELGLEVRAGSATNGVMSDAQIDWTLANLESVSISFDGLPAAHDKHRLTVLEQGSSHLVAHTLRRLDAAGFSYGLRVTVTHDQIASLPDSVEYICANFKPARIQVEPSYQLGRWAQAPGAETEGFIAAYREAQGRAARVGREILFSAARLGMLTSHFCGVTQDTFALSPDGNVSSCYEVFSEENAWSKTFFYGRPDADAGGYSFDLPTLDNLRNQSVEHREFCGGCFAKWTCAGDCYHRALNVSGGVFQGSERCHITRELTKDQILSKIVDSGGLFWHEPPVEAGDYARGKESLL